MTPILTYEQAVLLSRLKPIQKPNELCVDYICSNCPAFPNSIITDFTSCPFVIPYSDNYANASRRVRFDIKTQFPPEQYPELYI